MQQRTNSLSGRLFLRNVGRFRMKKCYNSDPKWRKLCPEFVSMRTENSIKYRKSFFLTILAIVCNFCEIYGPKALDDLSSYAIRILKEYFVVFYVEHCLRITQMSRKCKTFSKNEFCWKFCKFRILEG